MASEERKLQRQQNKYEAQDERDQQIALGTLLASREGRRFLFLLLRKSGFLNETAFTNNALTTAYRCGEQELGRVLFLQLRRLNPGAFLTLLEENENAEKLRLSHLAEIAGRSDRNPYDDSPGAGTYPDAGPGYD